LQGVFLDKGIKNLMYSHSKERNYLSQSGILFYEKKRTLYMVVSQPGTLAASYIIVPLATMIIMKLFHTKKRK